MSAFAQETDQAKEAEESQEDEYGKRVLEEVIVTATKRETDLLKTPVSVSAFTEAELGRQGINNVRDIDNLVPNMDIAFDQDQSSPVIAMRGVRSTNTSELGDPAVGLHVDGVYSPRPQGAMALMFDVERVEALRGPQGTLYGRNSTVGSVNVVSKRPDFEEFGGQVEFDLGRWNHKMAKASLNIPVSDTFALRAAFVKEKRDSYLTGYWDPNQWDRRRLPEEALNAPLLAEGAPTTLIQRENWWDPVREIVRADPEGFYNNADQYAYRISGLWEPTDEISWLVTAEKFQDQSAGYINTIDCDKADLRLDENGEAGNLGCEYLYGPGADEYTVVVNTPGELDLSIESLRSHFRWDFSDSMSFLYNAGFASQSRTNRVDIDAGVTAWDMSLHFTDTQYDSQSHELQLQSTGDGPLQWIAGAFYFKEENDMSGYFIAHMNDSTFWRQPDRTLESKAYFAQGTYDFTDDLHLTLGYRWTKDTKEDVGGHNKSCVRTNWNNPDSIDGIASVGCFPAWVWTNDGMYDADNVFNSLPVDYFDNPDIYSDVTNNDTSGSWSASNFRVGLDYDLTDDVMLYAYVADGFKAGGIGDVVVEYVQNDDATYPVDEDGNRIIATVHDSNYDPEEVVTWEFGAKGKFLDDTLSMSGTFFYSDYRDMQLASPDTVYTFLTVNQDPTDEDYGAIEDQAFVVYRTKNVGEAEIMGFEMDFNWVPYENGHVNGYFAWLSTEITSDFYTRWNFANRELFDIPDYGAAHSNDNPALYRNLKGNELAASPEFSFTVSYDHTFNLESGASLVPFLSVHWEDESYLTYWNVDKHDFPTATPDAFNDTRDAFLTVDASLKYWSASGQWAIEAYGYNLTDESIPYWAAGGDGVVRGPRSRPRFYGVRFTANF